MSDRRLAALLSFGVGLLSLSQEILWMRMLGFAQQGHPQVFGLVLGAFLLGVSGGAFWGKGLCQRTRALRPLARHQLLLATGMDLLTLVLLPALLQPEPQALTAVLLLIALCAAAKASLFPLVHQLGSRGSEQSTDLGRSLSGIYLLNVCGSALGPLLTGYVLLDRLSAESAFAGVALGTALLALVCGGARAPGVLLLGLAGWAMSAPPPALRAVAQNVGLGERGPLLQNRHGIVHTSDDPLGEIVYGGNAYDGRFVLDMANNSNGLDRAYLMAVLHPRPRRVLLIGLGGGAWLGAIAGLPGIEHIDVVELNPAYLQLMAERPAVAAALRDPRVRVQVDDGRRWLRRRPELRYDLVFSNTSFHWRSHVGLLLSQEFMQLVRARMAPGGILAFNTTGSLDALHTAQQNFAHALRYRNFAFASDLPLRRQPGAEALLRGARLGGQAAFGDALFAPGRVGHRLLHEPLQAAQTLTDGKAVRLIRDDDPVNEYRHGQAPLLGALDRWLPDRPEP